MPDIQRGFSGVSESEDIIRKDNGKNYLLLIAIDEYLYFPRLNNCVRDCEAIQKVFIEQYNYQVFKTLYNEQATKANIEKWLVQASNQLQEEDTLLIYFSGHGTTFAGKGAWVTVDAKKEERDLYFRSSNLMSILGEDLLKIRHVCIIVDCCFPALTFTSKASDDMDSGAGLKSRWAIASGNNLPVSDGEPGKHSPFAENLIELLVKNQNPLTINALYQGIKEKTEARLIMLQGDEGGDFSFTPSTFDAEKPDCYELLSAFFELNFGDCEDDFIDNFSAEQHFFNLLAIQGNNDRAGHIMVAKKLIRKFVNKADGSPHFDALKVEFGNIAKPIQQPWEALGEALGMTNVTNTQITKALSEKIKVKNLILFIEMKNAYDESLIHDFWAQLNEELKQLPEQTYSTAQHHKLFLFLLDKRSDALSFGAFSSSQTYAFGLQLSTLGEFKVNRVVNWKAGLKNQPKIFKPSFEKITFDNIDLFAENLVLKICKDCNLDQNIPYYPYKYIFEQAQTI
jgi:hypothetical protein